MTEAPTLVMPDSPLRGVVRELDAQLVAELGYSGAGEGWDEAWLWGREGFALFLRVPYRFGPSGPPLPDSAHWALGRVWLAPVLRRGGLLTAVWPLWLDRYGEFELEEPISPAMNAFLKRVPTMEASA